MLHNDDGELSVVHSIKDVLVLLVPTWSEIVCLRPCTLLLPLVATAFRVRKKNTSVNRTIAILVRISLFAAFITSEPCDIVRWNMRCPVRIVSLRPAMRRQHC